MKDLAERWIGFYRWLRSKLPWLSRYSLGKRYRVQGQPMLLLGANWVDGVAYLVFKPWRSNYLVHVGLSSSF